MARNCCSAWSAVWRRGRIPRRRSAAFCRRRRRFGNLPAVVGTVEYHREAGEPLTVAVLEEWVPSEGDRLALHPQRPRPLLRARPDRGLPAGPVAAASIAVRSWRSRKCLRRRRNCSVISQSRCACSASASRSCTWRWRRATMTPPSLRNRSRRFISARSTSPIGARCVGRWPCSASVCRTCPRNSAPRPRGCWGRRKRCCSAVAQSSSTN